MEIEFEARIVGSVDVDTTGITHREDLELHGLVMAELAMEGYTVLDLLCATSVPGEAANGE